MTSIAHHRDRRQSENSLNRSVERNWALGALAIIAMLAIVTFATAPGALALPLLAGKAAILSAATGLVAWMCGPDGRSRWLPAAGVFALAAITASIIGDPSAVLTIGN